MTEQKKEKAPANPDQNKTKKSRDQKGEPKKPRTNEPKDKR
jgi:hypothetical protein